MPSHYLNQWWFVYWRIYASLGLNELTPKPAVTRFPDTVIIVISSAARVKAACNTVSCIAHHVAHLHIMFLQLPLEQRYASRMGLLAPSHAYPWKESHHPTAGVIQHGNTVRCRYNADKFLPNFHNNNLYDNIYPMARPYLRCMRCLSWVHTLIYIPIHIL